MPKKTAHAAPEEGRSLVRKNASEKPLPVDLRDDEKISFGRHLAQLHAELRAAQDERKLVTDGMKEREEDLQRDIGRVAHIIRQGAEERLIRCEEHWDYAALTVTVVRLDTGEVVSTRTMREDERQMSFMDGVRPADSST